MLDFMKVKLGLFWITFRHVNFFGKKAKSVTATVKNFHKPEELSMQLTLEESSDKLSGHVTLFLIRHLFKHFNLLCTGVDICSILRFIQWVKLLLMLIFTRMAVETRKRAHFKYVIQSKLFSIRSSITHLASVCLMTYPRCRQLCHSFDLSDMARNYSGEVSLVLLLCS